MTAYHLLYRPLGSTILVDRTFEARSLDEAYDWAAEFVAEAHHMVGEHVAFDRAAGTVTIGAGYRSRRGVFSLVPTSVPANEVSAADGVRPSTDGRPGTVERE